MDVESIAQQFLNWYYTAFDQDRSLVESVYLADSMMTYEGKSFQGKEPIIRHLLTLSFQSVVHIITAFDAQPTINNGIIVFSIGQMRVDDDEKLLPFTQVFHLQFSQETQNYYILNDFFRINVHHYASG